MKFIDVTEKQCSETTASIKKRLAYLKDLSLSNMALRRLIKRNQKREGKISQIVDKLGRSESKVMSKRDSKVVCNLPFVLAYYTPENASRSTGLKHKGKFITVSSKTPIHAFDDIECLRYLNLTDEDSDSNVSPKIDVDTSDNSLNDSVQRNFYRESSSLPRSAQKAGAVKETLLVKALENLNKIQAIKMRL